MAGRAHVRKRARMRIPLFIRSLRYAFLLTLILASGCGKTQTDPRLPAKPESAWTGSEAVLFDDGIDVGAMPVGDVAPTRDEAAEAQIPSRIDAAEGVILAKIISVSTEPSGDRKRYRLELTMEGQPYSGTAPPDMPFSLALEPEAPAYGTIRALDSRLIGRKLVVFYRRYATDDGTAVYHFHLSPPTKAVVEAIERHTTRKAVQVSPSN
jgi:hypothetical protein